MNRLSFIVIFYNYYFKGQMIYHDSINSYYVSPISLSQSLFCYHSQVIHGHSMKQYFNSQKNVFSMNGMKMHYTQTLTK